MVVVVVDRLDEGGITDGGGLVALTVVVAVGAGLVAGADALHVTSNH